MAEQPRDFLSRSVLASDLSAIALTMTVSDGSVFPSTGEFDVRIDDELIVVGARSSNTLSSLTRGSGTPATTAAFHAAGSVVKEVITKRQMDALNSENSVTDQLFAMTNLSDHMNDSTIVHTALSITVSDYGGYYTGDTVEAALQQIGAYMVAHP